jgi:hypothetical protein
MERHRYMERFTMRVVFILLMLAGFVAKSQNPYVARYIRFVAVDTTLLNYPANTGGFYYNSSTGYMMVKDATGYHKLPGPGGGGGGGSVDAVTGTTNRIDATGTTNVTLDISATFEALLGKKASSLAQFASTTSAEMATILTNESGTGFVAMTTNGVFTTPNLGIPSALTLTNATGLPFAGLNVFNSADFAAKISNESGTGFVAMTTSPVFTTPNLGTPSALVLTNATGLPITGINAATSAQLAALLSDETSSGSLYFGQPTGANSTAAGSYTLQTTDVGRNNTGIVRITGASASTLTYPNNTTAALPLYSLISVLNQSSDTITVAFAGGVTHNDNSDYEIPPYGVGSFYKVATNTVDYFGSSGVGGGGGGGITECQTLNGTFTTAKTFAVSDVAVCNNTGLWTYTGSANVNVTVPLFATEAFEDGTSIAINNQSSYTITVLFTGSIAGGGHSLNTIPAGETGLLYFRDEDVVDLLGTRSPTEDLVATATLDFGNTAAGAIADLTIAVTGAVVGDVVSLGAPSIPNKGTYFAYVSATDVVTVRYANNDLTTAKDPSSGSFKVRILK